jgi:hypothetical protein
MNSRWEIVENLLKTLPILSQKMAQKEARVSAISYLL